MPQKKSAYKALRKSGKRQTRNQIAKKKIKDLRKKAEKLLTEKKKDDALKVYVQLQKALDKAAKAGGFMKENAVARYKSRLSKKIASLKK